MSKSRTFALAAAALVAGLVLGSIGIASAAGSTNATGTSGYGARLGGICRQAGASLADVVGTLTGQTADQVRTQRQAGKSFADIAKAKGVSTDKVASAAIDARKTALADAVKSGRITQAQADQMLTRMQGRVQDRVTATGAGCTGSGPGGGGGYGRGAGGGCLAQ